MITHTGTELPDNLVKIATKMLTQQLGGSGLIAFLNAVQDSEGNTGADILRNHPASIIAKLKSQNADPLDDLVEELRRIQFEEKGAHCE